MALERTPVRTRLVMRYPDEQDSERTKSYTFSRLAHSSDNERLMDLGDAFKSLMYDPVMDADLYFV